MTLFYRNLDTVSPAALVVTELILIMRIWAIYERKKVVLLAMLLLLACTTVASIVVLVIQARHTTGTNNPLPGIYLCILTSKLNILWAFWIPPLIFECIAFLLVAYKTFIHRRDSVGTTVSLMSVIFRDSLLYFFVSLCVAIVNALVFRFGSPGLYDISQGPSMALFSAVMSRLLLNLRKAGRDEHWNKVDRFSSIQFRAGTMRSEQSSDE
ncbi:hypothetical protein DFH06DRAFT_1182812 [Mycena polygramma]|nr:hypothetical protein DFH06DRAFT_1182812 [Mycena polygramma]